METLDLTNITWETIHNTAEHCMEHIFEHGTRVLVDWKTNFVYLLNEQGKTIEKNAAKDFSIEGYEDYLKRVAKFDHEIHNATDKRSVQMP